MTRPSSSKFKGNNVLGVDIPIEPKKNPPSQQSVILSQRAQKYSFKNDQVFKIFNMLANNNKFELPEPKKLEKEAHKKTPKYCHYHRS